jgi:hypothetical protein
VTSEAKEREINGRKKEKKIDSASSFLSLPSGPGFLDFWGKHRMVFSSTRTIPK